MNEIDFPASLTGRQLDDYLSRGWYRIGQIIFTTDLVEFKEFLYPVFWLRIALAKVEYGKSQKKIIARNSGFTVQIKPCKLSPEIEQLFLLYRTSIDFDAPASVAECLFGGMENFRNIYTTEMIEIRDGERLIALGFYDVGETSIAGILNFYHPDYKSKSLGKYLMLLKIDHAINRGKEFYYPGYIAKGYTKFDYKLFPDIGATEIFDSHRRKWSSFSWQWLHGQPGVGSP